MIPIITVLSVTTFIEKRIINSYVVLPITRRILLLVKISEDIILIYASLVLSYVISDIALTMLLITSGFSSLGFSHYMKLLIDVHLVFIYLIPFYILCVLISVATGEIISTFSTYLIAIITEEILIPSVFFSGRAVGFSTVLMVLNHTETLGLSSVDLVREVFIYSITLALIGLLASILALFIINSKDLA